MNAQSIAGQQQGVQTQSITGREKKRVSKLETIFGVILAMTAMYAIGSVLNFMARYLVR